MDRFVRVTVTRRLDHPLEDAYAWLTDYDEGDPGRTDAVVRTREVLERSEDRVRLGANVSMLGADRSGEAVVTLHPPDRWECETVAGRGRGSVFRYRLTPRGAGACLLTVHYDLRVRRLRGWLKVQLARPLIKRELNRMWAGFERAMAEELAAGAPAERHPEL